MDPKFLLQKKAMSLQRNGYRKILYFQKITISYASNRVLFGKEISQLNVAKFQHFTKSLSMIGSMEFKGLRDMRQVQYIKMLMLI